MLSVSFSIPPCDGVYGASANGFADGGYNNYVALWYQQWMGAAGQQGEGQGPPAQ